MLDFLNAPEMVLSAVSAGRLLTGLRRLNLLMYDFFGSPFDRPESPAADRQHKDGNEEYPFFLEGGSTRTFKDRRSQYARGFQPDNDLFVLPASRDKQFFTGPYFEGLS